MMMEQFIFNGTHTDGAPDSGNDNKLDILGTIFSARKGSLVKLND